MTGRSDGAEPILSSRLRLDPLQVRDADEMAEVLADPALCTVIGGAPRASTSPGAIGTVQATAAG